MRYQENRHSSPGHFVSQSGRPQPESARDSAVTFLALTTIVLAIILLRTVLP